MIHVILLQRAAAVIHATVHLDHVHPVLDQRNGRQEVLPLQTIGIQAIGCVIRGHHEHDAVVEAVRQQAPENHGVGDVTDVKLVKADQPVALSQMLGHHY